jgi:hypothetical protein
VSAIKGVERAGSSPEGSIMSNEQNLEKALEYAVNIIEAYQLEIRYATSGNPESPYKIRKGFCQGKIFTKALDDIERLKNPPGHQPHCRFTLGYVCSCTNKAL